MFVLSDAQTLNLVLRRMKYWLNLRTTAERTWHWSVTSWFACTISRTRSWPISGRYDEIIDGWL